MSRRESRVSLGLRQTDALSEFESFKKKFLIANKHITKLNSTLSQKIEELNAQLSALHVENLRLRASEIALQTQLKRERVRSSQIVAEAQSAASTLLARLTHLRSKQPTPAPSQPPLAPPVATRRPDPPDPSVPRLARAPTIPGILEDEEPSESEHVNQRSHTPTAVLIPDLEARKKPRKSSSRLPTLTRDPSQPPPISPTALIAPPLDLEEQLVRRRKPSRRPSGLLKPSVPGSSSSSSSSRSERPGSPLDPSQEQILLEDDDVDEIELVPRGERHRRTLSDDSDATLAGSRAESRKGHRRTLSDELDTARDKEGQTEVALEHEIQDTLPTEIVKKERKDKERKKVKEREEEDGEYLPTPEAKAAKTKARSVPVCAPGPSGKSGSKFRDVTNASDVERVSEPKARAKLIMELKDISPPACEDAASARLPRSFLVPPDPYSTRENLSTPEGRRTPVDRDRRSEYSDFATNARHRAMSPEDLPPAGQEPPAGSQDAQADGEDGEEDGDVRGRRVRKSVNYAEPKLNTKMRKPREEPSAKKRASIVGGSGTSSKPNSQGSEASSKPNSQASDTPQDEGEPPHIIIRRSKSKPRRSTPETDREEEGNEGNEADAEVGFGARMRDESHGQGKRRSTLMAARGSMIEGDEGRRHSLAV